MSKLFGHLKNFWPWLLGLVGGAMLWLKFVHDPKVAKEAKTRLKLKELDKRRETLQKAEADTRRSEEKLVKKRRQLKEDLDEQTSNLEPTRAADRMARRFGWGSDEG